MTRIFDSPATFAEDALDGFVAANSKYVARVNGGVIRSTGTPPGQVALVIGGGSGHYPAFAGLVGAGLAAGSACGNVFASPAAAQIYRVAKAAEAGRGVLLCYGNYTGDVLNFGQAEARLNTEGVATRTVLVTDDVASAPASEYTKRRGIAGDLFVFKIAGAAAEMGCNLEEVERVALKANEHTRSLGVAFNGCTLPGAGEPLFSVPAGHMFLGMGVHGEPGISDHSMPSATQLAELLVARLLEEHADDDGNRISVLLNGLGTIKYEELFLLYGRIDSLLRTAGFLVVEPECGELVTSLDMSGLSLSLCWLDDELERYWAAPADTPAYRKGNAVARMAGSFHEPEAHKVPQEASTEEAVRLGVVAAQALHVVRQVVADNVEWLGQLDAVAGDGDHGIGMLRGAEAAADAARRVVEKSAGIRQVLITAGEEWSEKAGGTSGALWSAALMAIGEVLGNKHSYSRNDAAAAVIAMRDAVVELGNAELGDKTMVDAMIPFTDAFTAAAAAGEALPRCLSFAAGQAVKAAEQTASLSPKKGRARALTQRSLGHPDPGAISFGLVMSGLARYFE